MLGALFQTMRPRQWTKNGFVLVPLFFDRQLTDWHSVQRSLFAFILLCLMSGSVYIMNDLADIEGDRQHPKKRLRPLPAGKLNPLFAGVMCVIFSLGSIVAGFFISKLFGIILISYLVVQIAYTFKLKHVVLIDVAIVAAGFILRIAAGVAAIQVQRFSPWLYVFGGFLALFMILGKRRHEIVSLGEGASSHRKILQEYTVEFLDILIGIVTTSAIVSYSLYTFLAEGVPENHIMMGTIPFLIYGIFRYMYLIHIRHEGGAPEEILLRDRPMQITLVFYFFVLVLALYVFR